MENNIFVLVADDNQDDRKTISDLLISHGYDVMQAIDGAAAIKVLEDYDVDVAILAHHMSPMDGFRVAKHIGSQKKERPGMVLMTDAPTTDLLMKAGEFGIGNVLQKPFDPMRLAGIVKNLTRKKRDRYIPHPKANLTYSKEEVMARAIALAAQNAKSVTGGPFGAVVTNAEGTIIGEGVNGVTSRCDPSAHAEVQALRRAAESVGSPWLEGCSIYCSAEPTMVSQALIINTGISHVYYALGQDDVSSVRNDDRDILAEIAKPAHQRSIPYSQIKRDEAQELFDAWHAQKDKVLD